MASESRLSLRISPAEKAEIEHLARVEGLSLTAFCRIRLLGREGGVSGLIRSQVEQATSSAESRIMGLVQEQVRVAAVEVVSRLSEERVEELIAEQAQRYLGSFNPDEFESRVFYSVRAETKSYIDQRLSEFASSAGASSQRWDQGSDDGRGFSRERVYE